MWSGLAAQQSGSAAYEDLVRRYSEAHRCYHTLEHLAECLACFEGVRELAMHGAEVEAALWFHDAVYEPTRTDNESRSAELAHRLLLDAGVRRERVSRIEQLVDMRPLDETSHRSESIVRFVIEVNQGWFAAHGVKPGARVEVCRSATPVRLARLHGIEHSGALFTDRLVRKFDLPVQGWRGRKRP